MIEFTVMILLNKSLSHLMLTLSAWLQSAIAAASFCALPIEATDQGATFQDHPFPKKGVPRYSTSPVPHGLTQ